jgi:2-isopropylmalate synthase
MDQLIVNLHLLGTLKNPLPKLREYCELVAETCGASLPPNYPVMGVDAFRTGTGVHAAAVIKAKNKGDDWLADRVYSGVPAGNFGARQVIEISPMSGLSNVKFWLSEHGYDPNDEALSDKLFQAAKEGVRTLTEAECHALVAEVQGKP